MSVALDNFAGLVEVGAEVREALAAGRAVVALESTIITHGMPYPENLETAQAVEAVVRQGGAVPATIAIMDGVFRVGIEAVDLDRLANRSSGVVKASRRDIASVLARGGTAGTTVATTMIGAHLAGIRIFATGGVGGVHRGAEQTFDISADLSELAKTPVAVVCAGAKSILDIPKTLEVLETHGVPVIGYQTNDFPAFYARVSGYPVDHRVESATDIARIIAIGERLGMRNGLLVANPIPETDALDATLIEERIARAIRDADAAGVSRKDLTPFLLQRMYELTEGRSLTANIALVRNNAALGAGIAVALADLEATTSHRATA
ncbi:pseudouridine-5'-phosphate glycosidase [Lichenihabitans sp. PAMC28606]|uniref:pseudouridine-5'-phosphate glycosidase n=1 Tax=Lichenihabitans sp. PAMC28606 TaxID=2880932 RepID=UPI001D0B4231|nr:pseudouridine-5'-phosphate glycosidase [Lichenihabitans sp. PAMC28606]UDL95692.1 pseudouridine-5'-phosphate glycosidase [Lichenihabitans sp. PAMC28606]